MFLEAESIEFQQVTKKLNIKALSFTDAFNLIRRTSVVVNVGIQL